jgi:hypothetical protein
LVVVVGIVLALQVDNWNEARKERNLEQIYLLRLAADIQKDVIGFRDLRRIFQTKSDFIEKFEGAATATQIRNDPEDWVRRLRYSLFVSLPTVRSATFDELAGSGRLAIIRDLELRSDLANYYAEYSLMSRILAQLVGDYKALVYESFPGGLLYAWRTSSSITSVAQVLEGYERLRANTEFHAAANAEVAYAGDLVFHCDEFIRMGEGLYARIATTIDDAGTP